MVVNLSKGANVSLAKVAPGMSRAVVGLGWDIRTTDGAPFDLDASALVLGADGKVLSDAHFVFYNNLRDPSGCVVHAGDNRTGAGDGDDEQLNVDLGGLSPDAARIVFVASIESADERGQTFGQVSGAYIRVVDGDDPANGDSSVRFDLGEDAAMETALVFGELYRHESGWKFRAIGQGYTTGLAGVVTDFGIGVG
ncbi:TerD family protein [Paraoerskovia marina]|uniref:Tellurium resistance protein TerD n=1 Tax=Paraoerskovia marina TaxID=545619 RepID=A0A1H1NXA3_9CELL|nr:TerD family protein [Paraoerskovia marina]SDS03574.1 tellurium resistance protein TerD [Paraoerskovia marina]